MDTMYKVMIHIPRRIEWDFMGFQHVPQSGEQFKTHELGRIQDGD
jgi:hypothetical protein